ncbi:MAG: hypothetical protein M3N45_01700, partial [Actinomycetota bacterium]|nr:hypothetical protein [Actinomycetota bacterium]
KETGVLRRHIAAVRISDGGVENWNPGANSIPGLYALATSPSHLGAGGDFTVTGGVSQQGFAQFSGAL